jgi:hypothetical protein
MIKSIIALLAGSSVLVSFGTASAQAKNAAPNPPKAAASAAAAASSTVIVNVNPAPAAKAKPHPKKHSKPRHEAATPHASASGITWQHWGGAPYASTRTEAMAKLGNALDAMVAAGIMPKEVADSFRANDYKLIRDNPDGITTTPGKHAYLPPETHLDGMMTGGKDPHLMTNVTVGKTVIGKGQVKAAEALPWALTFQGKTYVLVMPFTCFNWSLMTFEVAPPPPAQDDCWTIMTTVKGSQGDKAEHFGLYGPHSLSSCSAYRIVGHTGWISLRECPHDTCNYNVITAFLNGMELKFKGRVDVPAYCQEGCQVEYRVSRAFGQSDKDLAYFCLERTGNRGSCGIMVRHDDYRDEVATIFYDRAAIPAERNLRKLYWRFEAVAKDCWEKYQK